MRLQASTTETIKAKADRYYAAQCKRLAEERRALKAHSPAPAVVTAVGFEGVLRPLRKRATKKVTP